MSKQYDNSNRGVLFHNDRKQSDNHPDLTGNLNVSCSCSCGKSVTFDGWLSGWRKSSDAKGDYISLSIKSKNDPSKPGASTSRPPQTQSRFDSSEKMGIKSPPRSSAPKTTAPADTTPPEDDDVPF